jgi:short-subunit dehydrogenase
MSRSRPERIVITGASSGIGAATAEAFAARGCRLVLAARNQKALELVAARCRSYGNEVLTVPLDVADAKAVARLAHRAEDFLGGIDVWFSNVGVGVVGKFHEVPIASHQRVIETNLIGHLNDAHAVLPIFLRQQRGTFINMISIGGFLPMPWAASYAASKYGLKGMSEALRGEVSEYPHIHICDVYPTFVDTPALRHAGNYTGGQTSVPPGVLDPRTVAKAVVRVAERPRTTTGVGAPASLMKTAQVLGPNLGAVLMNQFMGRYFNSAEPAPLTDGNLFAARHDRGEIDGGFRQPGTQRKVGLAAGVVGLAAVATAGVFIARHLRR